MHIIDHLKHHVPWYSLTLLNHCYRVIRCVHQLQDCAVLRLVYWYLYWVDKIHINRELLSDLQFIIHKDQCRLSSISNWYYYLVICHCYIDIGNIEKSIEGYLRHCVIDHLLILIVSIVDLDHLSCIQYTKEVHCLAFSIWTKWVCKQVLPFISEVVHWVGDVLHGNCIDIGSFVQGDWIESELSFIHLNSYYTIQYKRICDCVILWYHKHQYSLFDNLISFFISLDSRDTFLIVDVCDRTFLICSQGVSACYYWVCCSIVCSESCATCQVESVINFMGTIAWQHDEIISCCDVARSKFFFFNDWLRQPEIVWLVFKYESFHINFFILLIESILYLCLTQWKYK